MLMVLNQEPVLDINELKTIWDLSQKIKDWKQNYTCAYLKGQKILKLGEVVVSARKSPKKLAGWDNIS